MKIISHSIARQWRTLALIAGAGALVAACGSNSTSASSGGGSSAAPAPAASAPTGGPATVMTHSGPLGTYLTDASGRTLYLFQSDTGSTSTCVGSCASLWPPLTTTAMPQAGSGVNASDLTTTMRTDGTMQVDFDNHPLYYFASDTAAGDTKGQGVNNGGLWYVVGTNGSAITAKAPATSSTGGSAGGSTSTGSGSGSEWS
ncbi:hypothetical protein GCM10023322_45100 [Rugosimonospora acidiphila]|uniref:Lipoprotein with Yx(FWY)xxD motif n=1 Tax=Rugosimonospora acidiphila TaxID=556531 RepID=A0ABP9S1M6_9ACTN